jgi:hypothetical protein
MTSGALSSAARGGGVRYRFEEEAKWVVGHSLAAAEICPRGLSSFPSLSLFLFLVLFENFANEPYLIQTNFELCKIQISPCCLSIGKDFVSEKVKTFGTQMHMMINMDACA